MLALGAIGEIANPDMWVRAIPQKEDSFLKDIESKRYRENEQEREREIKSGNVAVYFSAFISRLSYRFWYPLNFGALGKPPGAPSWLQPWGKDWVMKDMHKFL